jgi:hypothetical protein
MTRKPKSDSPRSRVARNIRAIYETRFSSSVKDFQRALKTHGLEASTSTIFAWMNETNLPSAEDWPAIAAAGGIGDWSNLATP